MLIYKYSGTLIGFLNVIFSIYTEKEPPLYITAENELQYALDTQVIEIEDNTEKAERIIKAIKNEYENIIMAFSSDRSDKEMILFQYIRLIFKFGQNVPLMQANTHVIAYNDLLKSVTHEINRIQGFLRFKELSNGIFYAQYDPDNNITQYLMPYFTQRNSLMNFIIHDTRRNILGMYNTKQTQIIHSNTPIPLIFTQAEETYQKLWHQYFNTVTISSRKNKRQQLYFMPRRYWKNMSETY